MDKKFLYLFILSVFLISGMVNAQEEQKAAKEQAAESAVQAPETAAQASETTTAQAPETAAQAAEKAAQTPESAAQAEMPQQGSSQAQAVQQPKEEVIKGIIKEIAADGSYIVVDNTKVLTTKEFIDDSYLEVGDNVEVTAQMTDAGLRAKNYNYIFEEEGPSAITEESPSQEVPQGY
ncbi:MAG: hypothetical protein WC546_06165 [Candidatus Omnitrophota bacterium]